MAYHDAVLLVNEFVVHLLDASTLEQTSRLVWVVLLVRRIVRDIFHFGQFILQG